MVRKCFVPKTKVSAGSVQDLINQMREGNGETEKTIPSENQVMTENSQFSEVLGKKGIIPKGVLSVDPEIQRMRDILTSGREAVIDSDGTISAVEDVDTGSATKAKTVPKAIVSAGNQWYEKNKDLFEAEIVAMNDFKPDARYGFFKDGRMYWLVSFTPTVAGRKTRTYNLALVYDMDHPKARCGSSVKAYLIKPTIDDLQTIVNRTPGITDKLIPHLLKDSSGELYLCSVDTTNCKDNLSNEGITSASTSLRFAMRWINIFELGLIDPETWRKFHLHGEI